ncbi:uncharacterized protein LOC108109503 [Drosophila eugracilis]|uniref:uncharacterized protein LOC108109503 n=1 Tax=Drosophila eugracilis TaxID=29029 RepID=UPI0007E6936C|nr:uncharacterized protein LOC108109503 [Drosophila eugracilis]
MDRNHKSDEAFNQSMTGSNRHVMWKLNDEEETFDSLVNYRRVPVRNLCTSAQPSQSHLTDIPTKSRTSSENWLLQVRDVEKKDERERGKKSVTVREPVWSANRASATSLPEVKETNSKERAIIYWRRLFDGLHKRQQGKKDTEAEIGKEEPTDIALTAKPSLALRYKPSHESLKYKQSRDPAPERFPSIFQGSSSCKMITDLKMESCSLPPQQTCVVREVEPRFAYRRRMSITNDTDSCCSGELEVPKNSPVQDQNSGNRLRSEVISVHVSTPTSGFMEARRRGTSPIRRRTAVTKMAAGTKAASSPAAVANKSSSASSGSAGTTQLPTFRQRQHELHRYRVLIERRRLDLLELKIAREREEALHSEILFHKDLQIKEHAIKAYEDNDCSNA